MAPSGGLLTVPVYTTLLALVAGDIDSPAYTGAANPATGWVVRMGKADDSVYVEGAIGPASSSAPFKLTNDLSTSKGIAINQLTLRFNPAIDSQSDWMQLLYDSMTVTDPGEKVQYNGNTHQRAAGGAAMALPESNVAVSSMAGMKKAFDDYGFSRTVLDQADAHMDWAWVYAGWGHNAPQSKVVIADKFDLILRADTLQWVTHYTKARARGLLWDGPTNTGVYDTGQDIVTRGDATIIQPSGNTGYEMWSYPPSPNPQSIVQNYGKVNFSLVQNMFARVIGYSATVEGPDRAGAVYYGNMGGDLYRSAGGGGHFLILDGFAGQWRRIRNDGQKSWIVAVSCYELAKSNGFRPPFGNYDRDGQYPYSKPPYGLSWQGFLDNPPPDARAL